MLSWWWLSLRPDMCYMSWFWIALISSFYCVLFDRILYSLWILRYFVNPLCVTNVEIRILMYAFWLVGMTGFVEFKLVDWYTSSNIGRKLRTLIGRSWLWCNWITHGTHVWYFVDLVFWWISVGLVNCTCLYNLRFFRANWFWFFRFLLYVRLEFWLFC